MTKDDSSSSNSKIGQSPRPDESSRASNLPPIKDFELRIAHDGTWFHRGAIIARPALVKLFATVLRREADGGYWLVTPAERGRVEVEDAPFLAVELSVSGQGRTQALCFRTNVDDWVVLDAEHPLRLACNADSGAPRPYILVRSGLEARLVRSVFYELVELAEPETQAGRERLGVWSKGSFFPLDGWPS